MYRLTTILLLMPIVKECCCIELLRRWSYPSSSTIIRGIQEYSWSRSRELAVGYLSVICRLSVILDSIPPNGWLLLVVSVRYIYAEGRSDLGHCAPRMLRCSDPRMEIITNVSQSPYGSRHYRPAVGRDRQDWERENKTREDRGEEGKKRGRKEDRGEESPSGSRIILNWCQWISKPTGA